MLDSAIALTVILFVLSIVSEKFIQLIRSYPHTFSIILIAIAAFFFYRAIILFSYVFGNSVFDLLIIYILNLTLLAFSFVFLSAHRWNWIYGTKLSRFLFIVAWILILIWALCESAYSLYPFVGGIILFSSLISLGMRHDTISIGSKRVDLKFFKRIKKDFVVRKEVEDKEKKENEITVLSILIGVVIAFAFKANFFKLIKDFEKNSQKITIGWEEGEFPLKNIFSNQKPYFEESWTFDPIFLIGIFLTGFFLSFGSKFFHDLLDRLYYAKKANQALNDPEILNQTSAAKVSEFVESYNVEKTYHKYKSLLLNEPGIMGVSIQRKELVNRWVDYLMISLEGNHNGSFEEKVRSIIRDFEIPIQFESNVGKVELTSGISFKDSIENASTPKNKGSIAIEVYKEDKPNIKYLLTCFHVVKHPNHNWSGQLSNNPLDNRVIIGSGGKDNGTVINALRSSVWECALIEVDEFNSISPLQNLINMVIKEPRVLDKKDLSQDAFMFSRKKNSNQKGELLSHSCSFELDFPGDTNPFQMYDLIKVWNKQNQSPIQDFGDSGNLLYDDNGFALGIVFAKSNQFTYAMNINFPLNYFNVKIRKP
ncbi:hypothetical protein [Aquiflexum gelatinilyticum]|uniref:Uncharacterized protein n=1 Tax=Aquiflexum gelatinilyticum TaxID=2961943 RepID=A0A9X2P7N1_9BACT|nr:hypothetical protein [Aquiflexum gelatinilyticum]MCR9015225.1 hypothetical protein [Aquiflexum gelatinilyticum]